MTTSLLASGDAGGLLLLVLFLIPIALAPAIFKAWLAVHRPEIYRERQRQEHERREKNKELAGKILGPVVRIGGGFVTRALKRKLGG